MSCEQELSEMGKLVEQLQQRVEHLRVSRRVLMNLIEKIERDKATTISRLEKENKKLTLTNKKYARWLMESNYRLRQIEKQIGENELSETDNVNINL